MPSSRYTPSPRAGLVFILLSAICFSLAGLLIKMTPWGALSINAGRSIFGALVIYLFMRWQGRRFRVNRAIVLGAGINFVMTQTFGIANKLTTAANAIVLQFTEPIFAILIMWIIFKAKPSRSAIITCIVVFAGILCFFFDELSTTGMVGNLVAIVSGLAYAGVFFIKKMDGSCFESSTILSLVACFVVGLPELIPNITASIAGDGPLCVLTSGPFEGFSCSPILVVAFMGFVQMGLSYVFLSLGLDIVSPITASLTSTIEPILNPIIVAVMLGETIGPLSLLGAFLVIGSTTAYNVGHGVNEDRRDEPPSRQTME